LLLVAKATEKQLAKHVECLKAEYRILQSELPKRVKVSRSERERLVKLGKPLGAEDAERFPTHIIRDRDTKFTRQFCDIPKSEGIDFREIAPLSHNTNPFAEAWVRRTRAEYLDHFIVLGENHLRNLIRERLEHYHT
jgi:hypothetical protein